MPSPERQEEPFLTGHYIRNPQHADQVRRLEIGKVLQYSLLKPLPLTARARVEAFKLLGEAGMMVDDELPTEQLLELYVMYVAPGLLPLDPFRVDEVA